MSVAAIFSEHERAWTTKAGLRRYYQREIFDRILSALKPGRTLELGAGPGFFGRHRPGMIALDIVSTPAIDVCGDAHRLPFADGSFDNVVGVDVLHHLAHPAQALSEVRRVLTPGGRAVLVEPWAGALGFPFYRYVHHEDCRAVADPWLAAFAPGKGPMDGNATIPRALLWSRQRELPAKTGLTLREAVPFGSVSYAATGGFQAIGLPAPAVDFLCRVERFLPTPAMRLIALRALFVLERAGAAPAAGI